jgi:PAS domain S-box-containing protein
MDFQKGSHILIIEDEDVLAKICISHLESKNLVVRREATGKSGLRALRNNDQIGVVVTDVKLPDMSGLDILREIKKDSPYTEVIVITAFPNYDIAMDALKSGADDYLEKPFQMEIFQRTVEKALERYCLRLENQVYQERLAELVKEKSHEVALSHEKLESEHHKLRSLINGIEVGIFFTDDDNNVLEINEFARKILGKSSKAIIGYSCNANPILKKIVKAAQPAASSNILLEPTADFPDVCINRRWFSAIVTPLSVRRRSGAKIFTLYDVTARHQLERKVQKYARSLEQRVLHSDSELQKAVQFSSQLLDAAKVFAFFAATDRRINLWNKFAEIQTGISADEATSLDIFHRLLPNSPPGTPIPFEVNSLKHAESGKPFQTSIKTIRGEIRTVSWTATPIKKNGKLDGHLFIGLDITDQKRLEDKLQQYNTQLEEMVEARTAELRAKDAQLVHSARLAVLGEIAAGIAHEMKQPLNGISITADLLKLMQKKNELTEDSLYNNLDMIKAMVDRMANTINHLRGFSCHGKDQFHPVSIADAVDGAFSILGEQLRIHGIDVRVDIPDDLPPVMGDLNQIEQVLINLFTNARDAMDRFEKRGYDGRFPGKGWEKVLNISLKKSEDGSSVTIAVSDTGHGIRVEDLDHIFEPFFTTKDVGDGTGLGLSISLGIIQQHHGSISVRSKIGEGTIFKIELPVPAIIPEVVETN